MSLETLVAGNDVEAAGLNENFLRVASIEFDPVDGNVTISGNTSLTQDMYYNDLVVNTGITLNPNGFRIFAKTITCNGTGKIASNGGDGAVGQTSQVGGSSTGGSGGAIPYSSGTMPLALVGVKGGNGANGSNGNAGATGTDALKGLGGNSGGSGGKGGTSVYGPTGGNGGTGGAITGSIYNYPYDAISAKTMVDINGTSLEVYTTSPTGGSGGAGGGGGGRSGAAGGGSGSSGGVVWISCQEILSLNVEAIGGSGGDGGVGLGSTGGGGGGCGGNGGVIVLICSQYSSLVSDVSGGSGGSGGSVASIDGDDGGDGLLIHIEA